MVLISSFFNEEYLLPWWLEHNRQYFDHAILFDYFSTDRSTEIVHSICPTWEVRKTRNKDWDFYDNDAEYMDAELEVDGYKMVLTTTEFLTGQVPKLPDKPTCFAVPFIRMVDNQPEKKPVYDKPLVDQKRFGFIDSSKHRFLHNYPDGKYYVGRHKTHLPTVPSSMWVFKYVFSPWTEEFKERKLKMKKYVNPKNIQKHLGLHHMWDREELEKQYTQTLERRDNRDFILYR